MQSEMFALSTCASCAEPIPHNAQRCSRCHTRYCGAACQAQHWNAGGHKDLCKKIKKTGGAEQYNADAKYKAAVTDAVEDCKEATKGQSCFICTEGIKRRTGEGLVSGYCACRGTAGFVHISCLVEQAKLAVADDMSKESEQQKWSRWTICRMCHQPIRGKVKCAIGWACWRTYADGYILENGQWKVDINTFNALTAVGHGLQDTGRNTEALAIFQTVVKGSKHAALCHSRFAPLVLMAETNLAKAFEALGRHDESLEIRRGLLERTKACMGATDQDTFVDALNLGNSLYDTGKFEEAKALLPEYVDSCCATYGPDHRLTLKLRFALCRARGVVWDGSYEEVCASDKDLEDIDRRVRRVLGEGDTSFVSHIKLEQQKRKLYHEKMDPEMARQKAEAEAARERQREAELRSRQAVVVKDPNSDKYIVASRAALEGAGLYHPSMQADTYTAEEAETKFGKKETSDGPAAKPKPAPAPAPKRAGIDYSKWDNLEDSD